MNNKRDMVFWAMFANFNLHEYKKKTINCLKPFMSFYMSIFIGLYY